MDIILIGLDEFIISNKWDRKCLNCIRSKLKTSFGLLIVLWIAFLLYEIGKGISKIKSWHSKYKQEF